MNNLTDYIPTGKENAIAAKTLAGLAGCRSVRELQHIIHRERVRGAVILSTCRSSGGYYLPANAFEAREFIRTCRSRARNTLAAIEGAERYIAEADVGW